MWIYVDITRGLKVERRHDSGLTVRDVVPSSRWPVMELSGDDRSSAFDRSFGIFLIVFVIEIVPDLFSPFWKPCSMGDCPWTAYGVLNRLTRDEKSWSLVTCSAPPYWRLRCNPLTVIDSDDVAMGVGASYNLCLDGWCYSLGREIQIGCSPCGHSAWIKFQFLCPWLNV